MRDDPAPVEPVRKYRNRKVQADGYTFDSEREYGEYVRLKFMAACGAILDFKVKPIYPLVVNDVLVATYTADFRYIDRGVALVVDVKPKDKKQIANPARWRVIKKLVYALYGITITEV